MQLLGESDFDSVGDDIKELDVFLATGEFIRQRGDFLPEIDALHAERIHERLVMLVVVR